MKIIYIDNSIDGHHLPYLQALCELDNDVICILPKKIVNFKGKTHIVDIENSKSIANYIKWISEVKKIVEKEKPDIIHFLYGDILYRHFGFGLNKFNNYKTIVTFHHIRRSFLKDISVKIIFNKITTGVVHTASLNKDLNLMGIQNVSHIEYPYFSTIGQIETNDAKIQLGLPTDVTVLGAIGGTRHDKGLDILLQALNRVNKPFHLLIAGQAQTFDHEFILEKAENYRDNVTCIIKYLSDEELNLAMCASDIIVLPYRKIFDGASGPLTEAVRLMKPIIGPDHGSLGSIIKENDLGSVFESENTVSLAKCIDKTISETYEISNNYIKYYEYLSEERFLNKYFEVYKNTYD